MRTILMVLLLALTMTPMASAQFVDSMFYGDTKKLTSMFVWGFISGTNGYGDIGKYQRFDYMGFEDRYLGAARLYFGFKRIVAGPDTIRVVARKVGENGGPGKIVDSVFITTDKLDTTGKGTLVSFKNRMKIQGLGFGTDTFFVGIEWNEWNAATSDTFALFCDSSGLGEKQQRVWERITYNGAWVFWPWINSPDASFEWNVDSDLWITALLSTSPTAVPLAEEVPTDFRLEQNYPNPFNPTTVVSYQLPVASSVRLVVCDLLGREVATLVDERQGVGRYSVKFDARKIASGIYLCQLNAGGHVQTRKMLVVR